MIEKVSAIVWGDCSNRHNGIRTEVFRFEAGAGYVRWCRACLEKFVKESRKALDE